MPPHAYLLILRRSVSGPEDTAKVLSQISSVPAFDAELQFLIFGNRGFENWATAPPNLDGHSHKHPVLLWGVAGFLPSSRFKNLRATGSFHKKKQHGYIHSARMCKDMMKTCERKTLHKKV